LLTQVASKACAHDYTGSALLMAIVRML
jgi:hypothetical protein